MKIYLLAVLAMLLGACSTLGPTRTTVHRCFGPEGRACTTEIVDENGPYPENDREYHLRHGTFVNPEFAALPRGPVPGPGGKGCILFGIIDYNGELVVGQYSTTLSYVKNNTELYVTQLRIKGCQVHLYDVGRREFGLPPGAKVYFYLDPCRGPVVQGVDQTVMCQRKVHFELAHFHVEPDGTYWPNAEIAGRGCVGRMMNPFTTDAETNRIEIQRNNIGHSCS